MPRSVGRTRQPKQFERLNTARKITARPSFLWSGAYPDIDAAQGIEAVITGAPTRSILPTAGGLQAVKFGGSQRYAFAGSYAGTSWPGASGITLCAGFICPTTTTSMITGTSSTSGGVNLYVTSANDLQLFFSGLAGYTCGLTLTSGDPYIAVVSAVAGSVLRAWVRNLRTNVVSSSSVAFAGTGMTAGNGSRFVGSSTEFVGFNQSAFFAAHFDQDALLDGPAREVLRNPWALWGKRQGRTRFAPPAAAAGIAFGATSNSGDSASSTINLSRTVAGSNRFLAVDVSIVFGTQHVVSVVDDTGGGNVPMFFIGEKDSLSDYVRVEQWGLAAPAVGTLNTRVTFASATNSSLATATAYTGVHQISPVEAFNSATAINTGSPTDASITITPAAANVWVHGAISTDDFAITSNQTSRSNVVLGFGSGAVADNNGPVSAPTALSWTGLGITAQYAIAGYAIRPVAAAALTTVQQDAPLAWGVRNAAQQDRSLAWGVRNAAQQDRSLAYVVQNAAQQDAPLAWAVAGSVQQDAALAWGVAGAVQTDAGLAYQVINAVQRDAPLAYAILGAAQQDAALAWGVRNAAQRDAPLAYQVINGVQRDAGLAYQVLNAVQRDAGLAWTVASVTSVERDAPLEWSVLSATEVVSDQVLAYQVIGSVQRDAGLAWGVAGAVQRDASLIYGVLSTVQRDASLMYALQGGVFRDQGLGYPILGPVQADSPLSWSVVGPDSVTSDQALAWSVLGVVVDTEVIVVTLRPVIEFRPDVGPPMELIDVLLRPVQGLRVSTGAVAPQ